MKLKAIEMQGFKSFPERTKITFEDGLTAIIGPNGSGKSNISDSIRWVLGEMSAKALRGAKMEDVIFNGTSKRQPANFASVSLYLDTSEEHENRSNAESEKTENNGEENAVAPKMRLSDESEYVITRKYYRTGDGEYYINKKQVRLKDVYELFYDTGIGREGYSVIGQGKIAEVLSAKDEERRSIFEEAAGISKFRYKKNEAERRLRDTSANLERINDIFREVETRVEPLRKEAENAEKYLVLAEEKKKLEVTLWLEKIDALRSDLANNEKILASSKLELDLADDELSSAEREEDEFNRRGYELMREKSILDERASKIAAESAENEKNISLCENDLRHYSEKTESRRNEKKFVLARQSDNKIQSVELKKAVDELISKTEKLRANGSELERRRNEIISPAEELNKLRETSLAKSKETSMALTDVVRESASLNALIESSEKNSTAREAEIKKIKTDFEELKQIKDSLEKENEEKLSVLSEQKQFIASSNEKVNSLLLEREKILKEVRSANVAVAAAEQQRESLLRLERLFEGYSDSVKNVMRQASEGRIKLASGSPINLHGTVASLLSANSEYVVAIETALGASVQFIVSETEEDAKAALRFLKSTGGGRITVLPLDTVKGRRCDVSRIASCDGFIGIASDLVICDKMYKGIADDLLGRTVIAEDLDKASVMAAKCGYSIKIVTKDGQIINAGGSYTGGSSNKKVGVFTRSSDIDKLDEEITRLNQTLLDAEMKDRSALKQINKLKEETDAKNEELSLLEAEYDDVKTRYSLAAAQYSEQANRLNEIIESGKRSAEEIISLKKRLSECEETEAKLKRDIEEYELTAREAEKKANEIISSAEELREKINQNEMELASVSAKSESVSERYDEICERIAEDDEKITEIESEISECTAFIAECEKNIDEAKKCLLALKEESADVSAKRIVLEKELEDREKSSSERRIKLKEAQIRRDQAFQSYTKLESGKKSAEEEYNTVVSRLWDEYELTYSAAEEFRLPESEREKMPARLNTVKSKIRAMGTINVKAVDEYRELKERYDFLKTQIDDLERTKRKLTNEISRLEVTMQSVFMDTFTKINDAFNRVFTELFGGGSARLELLDESNPLECGIDIMLHPPGKSIKSISLLSGGEQSFAAVALYLALQEINPAPFCVLDEIESALDEVNQARLMDYIKLHCGKTQYLIITHRRSTMERANVLYGVTMREKGVSEFLRLDLDAISDKIKDYTGNQG